MLFLLAPLAGAVGNDIKLPVLGDSSSGIISKQQEYQLGRTWLKVFRSRVQEFDDPLMQNYLENLIYNLATYSELEDPRIELVIVNNPSMNAFAVPGGIVGVHTGIFAFAENEDQMVSVLAHELAHLSQRHFARGLEAQRNSSTLSFAGLLAGLVLAATVGGDAGMAAMAATQAMSIENQLRYSRSNEKEADRFGLRTMEKSGRDPGAVGDMFETMLKQVRYAGDRAPEFLLTHPVTEKRIADARSRTMTNSMRHYPDHNDYYLLQARAQIAMAKNPKDNIKRFNAKLLAITQQKDAALYGLALSHLKIGDVNAARLVMAPLLKRDPDHQVYNYTAIEIEIADEDYTEALNKLAFLISRNPGNYPLLSLQAETLWLNHQYEEAGLALTQLARSRNQDPMVWYRLAEVRGLAGNISGVHQARAEYFILVGSFSLAREQLGLAQKLVNADFKRSSIVRQRLRDVVDMEEKAKRL
ncbi:MAG: Beta-barrel assembly-enhancing protease [Porticoccaceae bacterium UBA1117]|nr:MAG: Beta-barrel assembly-enhancing protease [Porticoccaceae bacterium UBA1117]